MGGTHKMNHLSLLKDLAPLVKISR